MKLEKFKERNNKKIGIILFTITCILLISGVILYRTFAIFETNDKFNVINGTVQDPGNLYFAFYVDNKIEKKMPQKDTGYIFDEENSYCGVTGSNDSDIILEFDKDRWSVTVLGLQDSRTKCNLHFVKGAYILGKPIKAVTSGDGLYEVTHGDEVNETLNDEGFKQTEWRYAGASPNNFVIFNDETWRIIGLVNVMVDEDHKVEQRVKIVRDELFTGVSYNSKNTPNWETSDIMTLLNEGDYYQRNGKYADTGLQKSAKSMIEEVYWNIGAPDYGNQEVKSQYTQERWNKTGKICSDVSCSNWNNQYVEGKTVWYGYIGLKYSTDYLYAMGGEDREECWGLALKEAPGTKCTDYNWVFSNQYTNNSEYLLSPTVKIVNTSYVKELNNVGYSTQAQYSVSTANVDFRPALYLKQNVKIISNDGFRNTPYILEYNE